MQYVTDWFPTDATSIPWKKLAVAHLQVLAPQFYTFSVAVHGRLPLGHLVNVCDHTWILFPRLRVSYDTNFSPYTADISPSIVCEEFPPK